MITVNVWSGIPFFVILLLAGLKAIDKELYDAASVDGANAWRRFLHVTLPGLRYVIIVAVLLSTIFTYNGFALTYILTGGGPGGATRLYAILAYEYAIQALRTSAGIAVAMTVAPFLFVLILFLGRYMMRREDMAHSTADDGAFWRVVMLILWPVRMLLQGVLAIFWAINGAVETVCGAISHTLRPPGASPLLGRENSRKVGFGVMYALIGLILLFEVLPFYFVFVTAFKSTLQIQQIQSMFWPSPWSLEHFVFLFTQLPFATWYANTILVAGVSTLLSLIGRQPGRVRPGAVEVARKQCAQHLRPGRVPDAAGADGHSAVSHPDAAQTHQHPGRAHGDVSHGRVAVRDVADDGLLPLDP